MIERYGLYNYHEENASILILFSEQKLTSKKEGEEVSLLYHEKECIGYEIHNFIRYAKIKYSGIIFLPSNPLIDVINIVLENNHLEAISYKKESGFIVKMNGNQRMVYAKEGTFLRDEKVSKGQYCTYHDLYIKNDNEDELIVIDEEIKEGTDFFFSEVK